MKVLVACEESQAVTKAFRKRGHEAYSCDIVECSGGHPEWHIQDDVREHLNDGWDLMVAHPVCTRLANSGVRWLHTPPPGKTWEQMWLELYEAVSFYRELRDAPIRKKAIENPVMHKYAMAMIGVQNRQIIQPHWFGDPAFKATGFELVNLPPLQPTRKLLVPVKGSDEYKKWSWVHLLPPSDDRACLRSKTFPGIAAAMAAQWGDA